MGCYDHKSSAQTVEFRIVEKTGQAIITPNNATVDLAVQVRITGGSAIGMCGMSLVISGEPDSYGDLARDRIMSSGTGVYYTGSPESNTTVGQGGLARQYTYLAGIDPRFNGVINGAVSEFDNTPGNQEIYSIVGVAAGSGLLGTPGVDVDGDGNPDTWSGNGGGTSPSDGATATINSTIAASYFAQGEFIDVYRFRYTVTNFSSARVLHFGFVELPTAQAFSQFRCEYGLWKADTSTFTGTITSTSLSIPVTLQPNTTEFAKTLFLNQNPRFAELEQPRF
jgi:hypothetical protein